LIFTIKMNKPTMNDVAVAAGVGIATVDRVINRRAPVRKETAQRVLEAAQRIGFRRTGLIQKQIERANTPTRLGVILQKKAAPFYAELAKSIEAAASSVLTTSCKVEIEFLESLSPQPMVELMHTLAMRHDALAIVAADHPQIGLAISQLHAIGKPVFALVSELSTATCAGYIGIDHRKVGRMAAWAISSLSPLKGKVGLLVGSHRYLCQEQNEISFRSFFRSSGSDLHVLDTVMSLEDPRLAEAASLEWLSSHPDLVGIYVAGGGVEGVVTALRQSSKTQLVVVAHDLTPLTRQALIEGHIRVVLSHPLDDMSQRLIEAVVAHKHQEAMPRASYDLPFITYTAANL
jgi:LacI family transcriptional regulator